MRAVVDRFEDGYAVVLSGEEEIKINIPIKLLPEGTREGSVLKISFELDEEGTLEQEKKIGLLLEKLRNKNRGR